MALSSNRLGRIPLKDAMSVRVRLGSLSCEKGRPVSDLTFNEYQLKAHRTAKYLDRVPDFVRDNEYLRLLVSISYVGLKLAGEAGELSEKVGKAIRDDGGVLTETRRDDLVSEAGDVFWYLAELMTLLGIKLGDVAQRNLDKLEDRSNRGVIHGTGDNR